MIKNMLTKWLFGINRDELRALIDDSEITLSALAATRIPLRSITAGSDSQFMICDTAGILNYQTLSGDVTCTHEGVMTITGTRAIGIVLFDSSTDVATGDGTNGISVPAEFNTWNITDVTASVHTKGVTGTTDVQVRRRRAGSDVDVLSTKITIGDEWFANDGVIDAANDDLNTGDMIFVDVDAVHTTAPKGLSVTLSIQKP